MVWWMLWPFWLGMDLVLIVAEVMEKPDSLVDGMAMREVSHMIMARVCMMPEHWLVGVLEEVAMHRCTMVDTSLPSQNLQIQISTILNEAIDGGESRNGKSGATNEGCLSK
jgi:hypothetical protein